jgi:hypothetical protein
MRIQLTRTTSPTSGHAILPKSMTDSESSRSAGQEPTDKDDSSSCSVAILRMLNLTTENISRKCPCKVDWGNVYFRGSNERERFSTDMWLASKSRAASWLPGTGCLPVLRS